MANSAIWKGNAVGVNKWHGVAQVKVKTKKGKTFTRGQIYKTNEYRAFVRSLATAFKQQLTPVKGYVHVDLLMFLDPSKDTDGPFKPIFDALQMAGIVEDDRVNHRGTYDRYDSDMGYDTILISVEELKRDAHSQPTIPA